MKDNYYFDNAATTWPKPEAVYRFMDEFSRNNAFNPGRSGYALSVESELMVDQTRRLLAEFFNFQGSHNRVVFSQNSTDSVNQLLFGVLQDGDHVITTVAEHNAVVRPLNHLARDQNITTTYLDIDKFGFIDLDQLEQSILPNTKMIVINHGSNVIGTVQDLSSIGDIARRRDVIFAIDSAQTAGVLPIDMHNDNIDVLVFTGHKGLFGPMGVGGMIVSEHVDVSPMRMGGTGINSVDQFQPTEFPHSLEAGTISLLGVAGLNAAQHWFAELGSQILGEDNRTHRELCVSALSAIHTKEKKQIQRIIESLLGLERFSVLGPTDPNASRVSTTSFTSEGISVSAIGEMLDADYHICVRAGLHCAPLIHDKLDTVKSGGAIRIAPGYFTSDDDVEHLISALKLIHEP